MPVVATPKKNLPFQEGSEASTRAYIRSGFGSLFGTGIKYSLARAGLSAGFRRNLEVVQPSPLARNPRRLAVRVEPGPRAREHARVEGDAPVPVTPIHVQAMLFALRLQQRIQPRVHGERY